MSLKGVLSSDLLDWMIEGSRGIISASLKRRWEILLGLDFAIRKGKLSGNQLGDFGSLYFC